MKILIDVAQSEPIECPYLEGKSFVQEYFFAHSLDQREYDKYLTQGWRRFGLYFFRPVCPDCKACQPLRISTKNPELTKSQKKVVKKNSLTEVNLRPLTYSEEIFQIYRKHSLKFDTEVRDRESFKETYFENAAPAFQSEYIIDGKLAGIGFLDAGSSGLSSVYFSYDPQYSEYSLGTFSIIKETQLAGELGVPWYYLGFFVAQCERMKYKGKFFPRQIMDWDSMKWEWSPTDQT